MKSWDMTHPAPPFGHVRKIKRGLLPIWLLCISLIIGCFHAPAPYRPSSWIGTPITMKSITDSPNQPLLQVIIVYSPAWPSHTALRLVCPDLPVLFWDPGGSYGISNPEKVRSNDLILVDPPDLETYLQFVWNHLGKEVEVFEWDLTPARALELYDVLLHGTKKDHPAGRFTTSNMKLFCTIAVSDFLHRFATKEMNVPKSFFFPYDLAHVLYTQSPKRVLAFRRGNVQRVYIPPPIRSSDEKVP
jgi:hypothetical protein